MEHYWIQSSSADDLPEFAIEGGYDCDGTPIYLGRAIHEDDLLPAKVIPSKGCAFVSWGGQEIPKNHYEVLVGPGYGWCPCENGDVPSNAVSSGVTSSGEPLYIGRGHHANSLSVGKVHPSHSCLYIPFGGQETSLSSYEVLVCENNDKWMPSPLDHTPHDAVVAGYDSDGTAIFVGRSWHEGQFIPTKVVPSRGEAYICYDGSEIKKFEIEILCGYNYNWINTDSQNIPNNAVFTDRFEDGEPLFVGRAHHCGSLTLGLVSPGDHCIFIPFGGQEIRKHAFDILVRQ
ncbi:uncharacterized protein LOC111675701 [Lucilia cuprina]|uniref:uncharacterized protein LOC111675701 n=1 Tax=Lucilia cuprina TaxID=7375 RepID=UPI001F0599EF|nr:uncharacterized protein LOC111675701 [Lucilia cuprina]